MVTDDKQVPLVEGAAPPSEGPCPKACGGRVCNPVIRCCGDNKVTNKINSLPTRWQKCCAWSAFLLFWWILFRGILQFIMFHWATMGCNEGALTSNRYPGGDWTCAEGYQHHSLEDDWHLDITNDDNDPSHCKYTPKDNAVPTSALLREDAASVMGQAFIMYENHGAGTITSAPVGMWWRTYGPWFWTYTYQDAHGQSTLYMRPTLMGMMGLYSESRIMRCDGAGDIWYFGEGSHWMSNRIRSFFGNWFGLQREGSFILYRQKSDSSSEQYGNAIETFHGDKSITFNRGFGHDQVTLGSGTLIAPPQNFPHSDFWSVSHDGNTPFRNFPPNYVMSACSLLMAFRWRDIRHERGMCGGQMRTAGGCPSGRPPAQGPPQQSFLAATSNASVPFFEETEDDVHQDPEHLKDGDEDANIEE